MAAQRPEFNPNQVTFDEGVERLRRATAKAGLDVGRVVTSRDPEARAAQELLAVTNIPGGFTKWQLPVYLQSASQLFISVGQAGADVPEHSHDDGDGIRFIVGGSIIYRDQELTTGDWMFIPAGQKYSFKVGPLGAVMCYCYCCCCAGRADFIPDLGYPDPSIDISKKAGQIDIARDAGQIDIARDAGQIDKA
jgi:quercetin dioxygenase-like cupin family protein